jgi:hypothetical protein
LIAEGAGLLPAFLLYLFFLPFFVLFLEILSDCFDFLLLPALPNFLLPALPNFLQAQVFFPFLAPFPIVCLLFMPFSASPFGTRDGFITLCLGFDSSEVEFCER